jgi:cell division protein ZapD
MKYVLYEHPLNERIRNYLKLEQLLIQVRSFTDDGKIRQGYNVFFTELFSITDILERNDIRGDLLKDLEKLEKNLVLWSRAPDIDTSAIEVNLQQTVSLVCQLRPAPAQWTQLKADKFLSGLKKRFAMQAGSCTFDLPQLQFWLHQDLTTIVTDIEHWLSMLSKISEALALVLKFIRQRATFSSITSESGFYQGSGEGLVLLRVKLNQNAHCFPTVSGNKFRYSIRFVKPYDKSDSEPSNQSVNFSLACC